jgi:ketosteroid isomerase-like protein
MSIAPPAIAAEIDAFWTAFGEALQSGGEFAGVEARMAMWCDDAVHLMPGALPMKGKPAIQAYFAHSPQLINQKGGLRQTSFTGTYLVDPATVRGARFGWWV